jgi:hypothetical protein
MKSEYTSRIDDLCQKNKIIETYRGKDIYNPKKMGNGFIMNVIFDPIKIKEKFKLPNHIKYWEYDGRSTG